MDFSPECANYISGFYKGRIGVLRYAQSNSPNDDLIVSEQDKKYDLFFCGALGNTFGNDVSRRKLIIEELKKKYSIYPNLFNVWDDEKREAIRKSRICMNIHSDESRYYEIERMRDYASNGAFILSDRMLEDEPFCEGEDYISFFLTELCDKIDYFLEHTEERESIAKNAFEKEKILSLEKSFAQMLDFVILESRERQQDKYIRKNLKKYLVMMFRRKGHQKLRQLLSDKQYNLITDKVRK